LFYSVNTAQSRCVLWSRGRKECWFGLLWTHLEPRYMCVWWEGRFLQYSRD
jgi:hypothetical protein